jgi:histidinol phosphatase-like enzyme (inositol monophosphatase family)
MASGISSWADLQEFAEGIAKKAGENSLRYFGAGGRDPSVELKADESPVTEADRSSELLMRSLIQESFPDHGIIGEEFPPVEASPGQPKWILDPIDGTRAFVAGVPLYTVLVAVVEENTPRIGVIHNPATKETVAATLGEGCYFNASRLRAPSASDSAAAPADSHGPRMAAGSPTVCCTDYGELARRYPRLLAHIAEAGYTARTWADAYGYLLLVTGRIQAMIDPVMNSWDIAPLYPIVEEAGAMITSLTGDREPLGESALAALPELHTTLLQSLRS